MTEMFAPVFKKTKEFSLIFMTFANMLVTYERPAKCTNIVEPIMSVLDQYPILPRRSLGVPMTLWLLLFNLTIYVVLD